MAPGALRTIAAPPEIDYLFPGPFLSRKGSRRGGGNAKRGGLLAGSLVG